MTEPSFDDPFLEIRYAIKRHREEARRIRRLVLQEEERGTSRREIARRLDMKPSTLTHWVQLARAERDGSADDNRAEHMPQSQL